jgi:hypothetical protein
MRLSWPRESDKRRAVVLVQKPPVSSRTSGPSSARDVKISEARFVHVSNWDIERHNSLTSTIPAYERSFLHVPVTWNPSRLKVLDRDLFDYCKFEFEFACIPTYSSFITCNSTWALTSPYGKSSI